MTRSLPFSSFYSQDSVKLCIVRGSQVCRHPVLGFLRWLTSSEQPGLSSLLPGTERGLEQGDLLGPFQLRCPTGLRLPPDPGNQCSSVCPIKASTTNMSNSVFVVSLIPTPNLTSQMSGSIAGPSLASSHITRDTM